MSEEVSHYFYVLHQIEFDLEIDHDLLLEMSRSSFNRFVDLWFTQRSIVTGEFRDPDPSFKKGLNDLREEVRRLEEE